MNFDMSEAAPGPMQVELNSYGEEEQQPPCKQPGCNQPALTTYGPYGRLCTDHKAAVQAACGTAKRPRPGKVVRPPASADGTVEAVLNELRAELATTHERTDRLTKAIAALEGLA